MATAPTRPRDGALPPRFKSTAGRTNAKPAIASTTATANAKTPSPTLMVRAARVIAFLPKLDGTADNRVLSRAAERALNPKHRQEICREIKNHRPDCQGYGALQRIRLAQVQRCVAARAMPHIYRLYSPAGMAARHRVFRGRNEIELRHGRAASSCSHNSAWSM